MTRTTHAGLIAIAALAATLGGCSTLARISRGAPDDCARHLAAADAVTPTPADSTGAMAAHERAMRMHDYHACLADESQQRARRKP